MSIANPLKKLVTCVILDLDGTLLNTDGIVGNVLKVLLGKYGKEWDGREANKIVGKTPFEASAAVIEDYGLTCSTAEFFSQISPLFAHQPGVNAGKTAEMEVIAVPSMPKQSHLFTAADVIINSLLDLQLENWGLPPFEDWVEETLPTEPWYIGGPVIKGFGRGSKVLGVPTANLSTEGYSDLLAEHPTGVYFGWAGLSGRGIFKMVMSIGWNPYFNNKEKAIEPWLLHDFTEDFYGEELRLVIVGYIRAEANFPTLESLIAKIHEDRRVAERALDLPLYSSYKNDSYLRSS